MTRKKRVIIGCTGSVASIKIPELVLELVVEKGYDVRVILSSEAALHFFVQSKNYTRKIWKEFIAIGGYSFILSDRDEWSSWKKVGDPVLHVQLCKWADVLLVAPDSANTLSKMRGGLCDSLLLSTFSAWDYRKKWIILAPAMNTYMWCNYVIEEVVTYFKERSQVQKHKISIVEPSEKLLACGDIGKGAMASVSTIAEKVDSVFEGSLASGTDDMQEKSNISHPSLLEGWATAYAKSPLLRIKYFWRYSPLCVTNRGVLKFMGQITTTVVLVSVMMALTGGASWYKLQSYMNQRMQSLRTKFSSLMNPELPNLNTAKAELSNRAAMIREGAKIEIDKLKDLRKQR